MPYAVFHRRNDEHKGTVVCFMVFGGGGGGGGGNWATADCDGGGGGDVDASIPIMPYDDVIIPHPISRAIMLRNVFDFECELGSLLHCIQLRQVSPPLQKSDNVPISK
jgi:hypothetical protein